MKVEFYRPAPAPADQPDAEAPPPTLVGTAEWIDDESVVECGDDELRRCWSAPIARRRS